MEMTFTVDRIEIGVSRSGGRPPPGRMFVTDDSGSKCEILCWQVEEHFDLGHTYSAQVYETVYNGNTQMNIDQKKPIIEAKFSEPQPAAQVSQLAPAAPAPKETGVKKEVKFDREKTIYFSAIFKSLLESGHSVDECEVALPKAILLFHHQLRISDADRQKMVENK
jgi:hypothetical protein